MSWEELFSPRWEGCLPGGEVPNLSSIAVVIKVEVKLLQLRQIKESERGLGLDICA